MNQRLKFKAWDKKRSLLTRLSNIYCEKGEVQMPNFILLQYTGLKDKMHQEIYDQDILLIDDKQYKVEWTQEQLTWFIGYSGTSFQLTKAVANKALRVCSALEQKV